ncbi:hypothetical protein Bequi_13490 [Brachybacterium sp. JHP9]|uniref:Uncharacterized protein n=1 Tax=Brachybacterium equifaecis TaxID=2910770 RepID=A0ABT0R358_9MICO|nr:hypothetical protein [Brachybacterium equifaecis]MCL6424378.1 hypothetical protein [Brachybacterium equifaecis]
MSTKSTAPAKGAARPRSLRSRQWAEDNVIRDSKGRFMAFLNAKSHASIDGRPMYATAEQLDQRSRELEEGGFVRAIAEGAYYNPRKTGGQAQLEQWWDTRRMQSEYTDSDKGIPQMPDDWTPNRAAGNSLSGHRRTYRRLYKGNGISMRMPSAASIRSFAETQDGKSFDVPVEAAFPGGTVSGWVRCRRTEDGLWMTQGLDFHGRQAQIQEAVSAVLEARRVTTALSGVESLDERRLNRLSRAGARVIPSEGGFMEGFAVNPAAGVTFTKIRDKVYANAVVSNLREIAALSGPEQGRFYNERIRSAPPLGLAQTCEKCQAVYHPSFGTHICMRSAYTGPRELADPMLDQKRQSSGILAGVLSIFGRDARKVRAASRDSSLDRELDLSDQRS